MPKKKFYLVTFNNICGAYEFSGQKVLEIGSRAKIENAVHRYFINFYDSDGEDKSNSGFDKCNHYYYNMDEVAVNDIRWKEISEEQAKVLRELHIV